MFTNLLNLIENNFLFVLFPFWFAKNVLELLHFVAIVQQKEYRSDRIISYLKSGEFKKTIYPDTKKVYLNIFLIGLILNLLPIGVLFSFIFAIYIGLGYQDLYKRKLALKYKRPVFSSRVLLILLLVFGVELSIIGDLLILNYLQIIISPIVVSLILMIMDEIIPVMVLTANMLIGPIVNFRNQLVIYQAKEKLFSHKELIVIGITGSYGKTSVKEILVSILSTKYKVLYTPSNINVDVGIANYVLNNLNSGHEILVVEMGAYKEGEINKICDMVKPTIGIITAIGDQHVALFGSPKKLINAKFELVRNLPTKGLAVLNGDDEKVLSLSKKLNCDVSYFSKNRGENYIKDIKSTTKNLSFTAVTLNHQLKLTTNLVGEHNAQNILIAVIVALGLKVKTTEISKSVSKLKPLEGTLKPKKGSMGAIFLDDSHNASLQGSLAALEYLKLYKNKNKLMVFDPILDLGEYGKKVHETIGYRSALVCDKVYITGEEYKKNMATGKGLAKTSKSKFKWFNNRQELKTALSKDMNVDSVILFEGRSTKIILEELEK